MTDDELELSEMLPFAPSEIDTGEIEIPEVETEQPEPDDVIEVSVTCPRCREAMSINTVVSQADREHNGRSRYEAVCSRCQMAVIVTVMKSVGDYNDLMGFDSPEIDWEVEDLSDNSGE